MNEPEKYIEIPIPVHPDDKDLPISFIQLKMPSGKVIQITIPLQGSRTIQNVLDILEIWRPTIVVPDPPEESICTASIVDKDEENRERV